jgi:hypothetical protein
MSQRSPIDSCEMIRLLCEYSKERSGAATQLHLDLVRHRELLDQLGYEALAAVYECAAELGLFEVKSLLRSIRMGERFDEIRPEGFVRKLEAMTLGARKQLSRKLPRNKMEFLLFDNDPRVIRDLLLNPKLIERDVLRIASRHMAPASVLEEVCKSDRWMTHYGVRKALVFNPSTPRSYAIGLLNHLRKNDLKLFLQSGACDEELTNLIRTSFHL